MSSGWKGNVWFIPFKCFSSCRKWVNVEMSYCYANCCTGYMESCSLSNLTSVVKIKICCSTPRSRQNKKKNPHQWNKQAVLGSSHHGEPAEVLTQKKSYPKRNYRKLQSGMIHGTRGDREGSAAEPSNYRAVFFSSVCGKKFWTCSPLKHQSNIFKNKMFRISGDSLTVLAHHHQVIIFDFRWNISTQHLAQTSPATTCKYFHFIRKWMHYQPFHLKENNSSFRQTAEFPKYSKKYC